MEKPRLGRKRLKFWPIPVESVKFQAMDGLTTTTQIDKLQLRNGRKKCLAEQTELSQCLSILPAMGADYSNTVASIGRFVVGVYVWGKPIDFTHSVICAE